MSDPSSIWVENGVTVEDIEVGFYGDDTNRILGIKWTEPDSTALDISFTGFPYALRLYKYSATGDNLSFPFTNMSLVDGVVWYNIVKDIPANTFADYDYPFVWGPTNTPVYNNLQTWQFDNQFSIPVNVNNNNVYQQFLYASAAVSKFLDINDTASITITSGGGNSNNAILNVKKNSNISTTITINDANETFTNNTATYVWKFGITAYDENISPQSLPIIGEIQQQQGILGFPPYSYDPSNQIQGLDLSANFNPQVPGNNTMLVFGDAIGQISYNSSLTILSNITIDPFISPGIYILVIERHYKNPDYNSNPSQAEIFISTIGHFCGFIPIATLDKATIEDVSGTNISLNSLKISADPYGAFDGSNSEINFLTYQWDITIPTSSYYSIINGETTIFLDIDMIQKTYRQRGTGIVKGYVTYDYGFGADYSFNEVYPLLTILGSSTLTTTTNTYTIDLCLRPTSFDPPPWSRYTTNCASLTPEERATLQMRRKAETLKHLRAENSIRQTKAQYLSFVMKGFNQRKKTYATQSDTYTNPNLLNLPTTNNNNGLTIPPECSQRVITAPSTSSDVPGKVVMLTYDPSVPLVNYINIRQYPSSQEDYNNRESN